MKSAYVFVILFNFIFSAYAYAQSAIVLWGGGKENDNSNEISKDILREAYHRLGIKVTFEYLPPPRGIEMSNRGELDGEMHRIIGIDKQFPNLIRIPIPINVIEIMPFTKNQDIVINKVQDLKPYNIAIRRGVKFAEELTKGMRVNKTVEEHHLFRMLDFGRIDIVISTRIAGLQYIKELRLKGIRMLEPPLAKKDLFHYLHHKHKILVPQITSMLRTMQKAGFISKRHKRTISELSN